MSRGFRGPIIAALLLAASATGGVVGYGIGVLAALHGMQQTLLRYVSERTEATDRYPADGLQILAEMSAVSFPPCSDAELNSFRRMVLNSQFIKDAGRMHGRRLACSAAFPAVEMPDTEYAPAFKDAPDILLYNNIDALRVGPLFPIVIRKGDYYVALDPYRRDETPNDIQFLLTMKNAPPGQSDYLGGSSFPGKDALRKTNSYGRTGKFLYATKCSNRFSACITAYIPAQDAIHDQRSLLWTGVLGGMLTGSCIGLLCLSFYRRTRGIEYQLRRAIDRGKLYVVYQPLVDLRTRKVVGGEALVRWTDEDDLPIPPDVFVRIAEERGFVNRITNFVVSRVLADFGGYMAKHPEFRINVNISAYDLADPALPGMLEESLHHAGVLASSLGIELTETATSQRTVAMDAVAMLRDRGHRVYIDDFGTGYSSLAYLKDLAVDGIKIDKSFTGTVGTDSVTEGILPLILGMAHALKLDTVAEGIETEAHYVYYAGTSLPMTAQGWFFGHPVLPKEFHERWLQAERSCLVGAAQE